MTTDKLEEIIERARTIHDDKYDYSLCEYINMHTHMRVICKIHGEFNKTPADLIHKKSGCKYCANEKRKKTNLEKYGCEHPRQNKDVLEKQKQTNLERYGTEYPQQSDVVKNKIKTTNLERYGNGCSVQNKDIQEKIKHHNLVVYGVEWCSQRPDKIDKTKQTWLNTYDLDHPMKHPTVKEKQQLSAKTTWDLRHDEILEKRRDTCRKLYDVDNFSHLFLGKKKNVTPNVVDKIKLTNIERYGVDNLFRSDKVKEAVQTQCLQLYGVPFYNQRHLVNILPLLDSYDWLHEQYNNQGKSAIQIANELNIQDTTVGRYLKKHNIPIKNQYTYSHDCIKWLESIMQQENIYIQHAGNGGEYKIPSTKYKADGYCAETNTVYEFHGDYWHGNPNKYNPSDYNSSTHCTMGELYERTIKKEQCVRLLGYNLITIWEEDFQKQHITFPLAPLFKNCI